MSAIRVVIHAGPESSLWLSPGCLQPSVRLNLIWIQWPGNPLKETFGPYLESLRPFSFRQHWGKCLPGASPSRRACYAEKLPRFCDFLTLRDKLDSDQTFVNDYWQSRLGS